VINLFLTKATEEMFTIQGPHGFSMQTGELIMWNPHT